MSQANEIHITDLLSNLDRKHPVDNTPYQPNYNNFLYQMGLAGF